MSAVRIRVYEDQLGDLRVEVDGRPVLPGTSVPAVVELSGGALGEPTLNIADLVRRTLRGLVRELPIENTEVTD